MMGRAFKKADVTVALPPTKRWQDRLWWLMERYGVNGNEAALILGKKAAQTVYKYLNGVNDLSITDLIKLADFFGVTTDFICGRTEDIDNAEQTDKRIADWKRTHKRFVRF